MKRKTNRRKYISSVAFFFTLLMLLAKPSLGDSRINFFPDNPTSESFITYEIYCRYSADYLSIDYENKIITIKESPPEISFGCLPPRVQRLGYLPSGTYRVEYYDDDPDDPDPSVSELVVSKPLSTANHESPARNSIQSGIGVIRGWVCDSYGLVLEIDGVHQIPINGRQSREDTLTTCGDTDNGYALLLNWNLIGEGYHTLSISHAVEPGSPSSRFIVQDLPFRVVTMEEEYYTDLDRKVFIDNFPVPGKSVTVEWSTEDQNFKIIQYIP